MKLDNLTFKKIIIIFWMLWWLITLWTDVIGGLAHLKLITAAWAPDTNYPFLVTSLKMYGVSPIFPAISFVGIIVWSAVSAVCFMWASYSLLQPKSVWLPRARVAFIISLTYWLGFFIADQMVMKFDLEQNHMVQGGFELLTFLCLYLLPDDEKVAR